MFPRLPLRHDLGGLATGAIPLSGYAPPGALCTEEVTEQIKTTYARGVYNTGRASEAGTTGWPWGVSTALAPPAGGRHVLAADNAPVAGRPDRQTYPFGFSLPSATGGFPARLHPVG